jgi:hypothetical protein
MDELMKSMEYTVNHKCLNLSNLAFNRLSDSNTDYQIQHIPLIKLACIYPHLGLLAGYPEPVLQNIHLSLRNDPEIVKLSLKSSGLNYSYLTYEQRSDESIALPILKSKYLREKLGNTIPQNIIDILKIIDKQEEEEMIN